MMAIAPTLPECGGVGPVASRAFHGLISGVKMPGSPVPLHFRFTAVRAAYRYGFDMINTFTLNCNASVLRYHGRVIGDFHEIAAHSQGLDLVSGDLRKKVPVPPHTTPPRNFHETSWRAKKWRRFTSVPATRSSSSIPSTDVGTTHIGPGAWRSFDAGSSRYPLVWLFLVHLGRVVFDQVDFPASLYSRIPYLITSKVFAER